VISDYDICNFAVLHIFSMYLAFVIFGILAKYQYKLKDGKFQKGLAFTI